MVVANFRHQPRHDSPIGFPAEGLWKLRFNSDWRGYSDLFEGHDGGDAVAEPGESDGLPFRGRISIAPYSVLIFSQDRR